MNSMVGAGGARPSKAASWVAAVIGLGMLITVGCFFLSPLAGVAAFGLLWIVALVSIVGFHLYNATSDDGANHLQFSFRTRQEPMAAREDFAQRLRDLEALRRDGLLSDAEYERKRQEILASAHDR